MKMKFKYIILLLNLFTFSSNAQTIILEEIKSVNKLLVYNNDLYISHGYSSSAIWYNTISKINLLDSSGLQYVPWISNYYEYPPDIDVYEHELYYSSYQYGEIYKETNIDSMTPERSTLLNIKNQDSPLKLAFNENYLYFSTAYYDELFRVDLITNSLNPIKISSIEVHDPELFEIHKNQLYFSDENRIFKVDINSSSPKSTLIHTSENKLTSGCFNGDELYYSTKEGIFKIKNVTSEPIVTENVIIGINEPNNLVIYDDQIYFTEYYNEGGKGYNRIYKFNTATLSNVNPVFNKKVIISPNPTFDNIKITGIDKGNNYIIYDSLGKVIKRGIVYNNEIINLKNIKSGVYFIKLNNRIIKKIIKK